MRVHASHERLLHPDGGDDHGGRRGAVHSHRHLVTLLPPDVTHVDGDGGHQHVPGSHQSLHKIFFVFHSEAMHCGMG